MQHEIGEIVKVEFLPPKRTDYVTTLVEILAIFNESYIPGISQFLVREVHPKYMEFNKPFIVFSSSFIK